MLCPLYPYHTGTQHPLSSQDVFVLSYSPIFDIIRRRDGNNFRKNTVNTHTVHFDCISGHEFVASFFTVLYSTVQYSIFIYNLFGSHLIQIWQLRKKIQLLLESDLIAAAKVSSPGKA